MQKLFMATILFSPLMELAAANDPQYTQTTSVTVNGYGSWEEDYAAERKRLASLGLK